MDWLNKTMAPADELKVFMGLYPPGHEQEGRTTVILWPYLKEKPLQDIDPFNEGQGLP
jgi:hypothetical protein